jgi:hypothetical protein
MYIPGIIRTSAVPVQLLRALGVPDRVPVHSRALHARLFRALFISSCGSAHRIRIRGSLLQYESRKLTCTNRGLNVFTKILAKRRKLTCTNRGLNPVSCSIVSTTSRSYYLLSHKVQAFAIVESRRPVSRVHLIYESCLCVNSLSLMLPVSDARFFLETCLV